MPKPKESKYKAQLEELGFQRMEQTKVNRLRHKLHSKKQRRLIRSGTLTPTFSSNSEVPITFVTDEYGGSWFTNKVVDLTHLGFLDSNPMVEALKKNYAQKSFH